MARLQGLAPLEARRFRTGRPSLDLAHTGGDGSYAVFELFHNPADVSRWLGVIADVDDVHAVASDVEHVRVLRRAIWNIAQHAIGGGTVRTRDLAVLNRCAGNAAPVMRLLAIGQSALRRPVTAPQVLAAIAHDAVDLFASPLANRIRTCAAPDCGLLYVDRSRTGNRKWCAMQRCGTRTKVRTHRQHQRNP